MEGIKLAKERDYERVEITFSKKQEIDIELYNYLLESGKVIGNGPYLKQLLYEDKIRKKGNE